METESSINYGEETNSEINTGDETVSEVNTEDETKSEETVGEEMVTTTGEDTSEVVSQETLDSTDTGGFGISNYTIIGLLLVVVVIGVAILVKLNKKENN